MRLRSLSLPALCDRGLLRAPVRDDQSLTVAQFSSCLMGVLRGRFLGRISRAAIASISAVPYRLGSMELSITPVNNAPVESQLRHRQARLPVAGDRRR